MRRPKHRCAACDATRRDVTLWRQIVAIAVDTVCCWPTTTTTTTPRSAR